MLFIAFVENAFKHGTPVDGFLDIHIDLKTNETQLIFTIQNTIKKKDIDTDSHGIGLENTQKRLETLFPNAYTLQYTEENTIYKVHLEIQLNS